MVAYTFRMPAGIPGDVNRVQAATVETHQIDASTGTPARYGIPVKLVSGKVRATASGDAGTDLFGWLVRPYPTNSGVEALGAGTPASSGLCDVLRRGYMSVKLNAGTAAKGGAVYVRVTASGGAVVGDIETAADSAKCVVVPGAKFTGPADANGITEVEFNI